MVDLFENVEIKIKEMKKQLHNELSNEVENMIKDIKIRSNADEVKVKDIIEENKKLIQKVNKMEEKMHSNIRPDETLNLPQQQNQIVVLEEMKKNINEQVEQGINEKLKEGKIRKDIKKITLLCITCQNQIENLVEREKKKILNMYHIYILIRYWMVRSLCLCVRLL